MISIFISIVIIIKKFLYKIHNMNKMKYNNNLTLEIHFLIYQKQINLKENQQGFLVKLFKKNLVMNFNQKKVKKASNEYILLKILIYIRLYTLCF